MLVVLLALTTAFLDLGMPTKHDNCKSLKVANNKRCVVCRKPGDALVRKNFGRICLTAKSRAAEQSCASASDVPGCSPCEEEPSASSCSCCSSFSFGGSSAGTAAAARHTSCCPQGRHLTQPHCLAGLPEITSLGGSDRMATSPASAAATRAAASTPASIAPAISPGSSQPTPMQPERDPQHHSPQAL